MRKRNDELVQRACALRDSGATHREIAMVFGVCQSTVRQWVDPEYYEAQKSKAIQWQKDHPEKARARSSEAYTKLTRRQKDVYLAKQRARYANDPKVRERFRLLAQRYRGNIQYRLRQKVYLANLGHSGRYPRMFSAFMHAATGMAEEAYKAQFDGDGHMDHIVPLVAFDLTNPEHLLRAVHPSNVQLLPARENMIKHDSGRDVDVMLLPRVEGEDALVQAQSFISRQLMLHNNGSEGEQLTWRQLKSQEVSERAQAQTDSPSLAVTC